MFRLPQEKLGATQVFNNIPPPNFYKNRAVIDARVGAFERQEAVPQVQKE